MNDINIKNLKIPYNYVLVKIDDDHNTYHSTSNGADTGISVAPWGINQASHLALTGEVVMLPQRLRFNGYKMAKLKRAAQNDDDQKVIADMRRASVSYDVPMEVQVGYKVYFEYTTRINAFDQGRVIENEQGKFIFICYDQLIMAFRPNTDFSNVKINDVYMLNGFVLIKILEYTRERSAQGIVGNKTEGDLFLPINEDAKYVHRENLWYATVLTAGCNVKAYADFPKVNGDATPDEAVLKPGVKICFDGRQKKRLEVEHHRVIFRENVFHRIQRKDILNIFPSGNII